MTMNAAAPAAQAPMTSSGGGADARAAALKESLESNEGPATSEPAGESSATPPRGASSPADSAAATPPAALDQAAKDRLERIAKVRSREEADEAKRRDQQKRHAADGELEKLRKRVAELEPNEAVFSSEEALLAAAEAKGMTPEKLVQWMRTRLTDPAAVARAQTKTEADKLREELKTRDEKAAAEIAKLREEIASKEQNHALAVKTQTFLGDARSKTETHPRTAKLQAKFKDEGLIAFANQFIAPLLPQGYSPEDLHAHVEQFLDELDAFGGSPATLAAVPASGAGRPPTKNGAGQPATTLSNALTSGRDTLVEETPLHKLAPEERIARLKAKLDRE